MNIMNRQYQMNSSVDFALSQSFSRRQMTMINSYHDSSISHQTTTNLSNPRCRHCGKFYCQIDFIFSWILRYQNSDDKHIQQIISKCLPKCEVQTVCEKRLVDWYNSTKMKRENQSNYTDYLLSQSIVVYPRDESLNLTRLSTIYPSQTFQTQNRAGLYQLCSNGRYIIADDWCQNYKGYRLAEFMRCLTIYNQYEEQCLLMLPEFNRMTQTDSIQSITWHEQLQLFLFITSHRVYQCEPEGGRINQINEYEIPSSRHSLSQITSDQQSYVFLAYEYPSVSVDLWLISSMSTWSLLKRWSSNQLFSFENNFSTQDENLSTICGIGSMRYANQKLHLLVRHERHWCVHLFSIVINQQNQQLIPQRCIDIDLIHLRFAGENFQMEILPGEQGWLFAIRRSYLIHLHFNGKDAEKIFLPTSKRCADSISNVCIMDERGKRRENGKHLVVRDVNSIRFYKL